MSISFSRYCNQKVSKNILCEKKSVSIISDRKHQLVCSIPWRGRLFLTLFLSHILGTHLLGPSSLAKGLRSTPLPIKPKTLDQRRWVRSYLGKVSWTCLPMANVLKIILSQIILYITCIWTYLNDLKSKFIFYFILILNV